MAGRGRDQTLPAWMTQGGPSHSSGPGGGQAGGHHGPQGGAQPGPGQMAPGFRPPAGMNQGMPGRMPQGMQPMPGPPPRGGPGGLMGPGPRPPMRPSYGQPQPQLQQPYPGRPGGAPPGLMQGAGPSMGYPPQQGGPMGSLPPPMQQGPPPGLGAMPAGHAMGMNAMGPRPGMGAPQAQQPLPAPMHGHPGPVPGVPGPAPGGPVPGGMPQPLQQPLHQQPGAQPAASAAAAASVQAGAAAGGARPRWTAHTAPDGRTYYYNRETKKSVWSKPPDFDVPAAAPAAAAEPAKPVSEWKEFTAPDGRKYYYNKATNESKWSNPDATKASAAPNAAQAAPSSVQVVKLGSPQANGLAAPAAAAAASPAAASPAVLAPLAQAAPAAAVVLEPKVESPAAFTPAPVVQPIKFMYHTKEEAKEAFKELLVATNVSSEWTWEATMRKIIADPRYSALKSLGEKKACFKEYQDARVKTEKEESRQKAKQAKEDFTTMLEESDELPEGTRWGSKVARIFDLDPRWKALDSERLREELFSDHMKERDRKARETRKAEQKKKAADFKELLESLPYIKATSSWRKVQPRLEGEPSFEACDKVDRLEVFQAHLKNLEKAEREILEKEKADKARKERQNRDAFRELLLAHAGEGKIHAKLRWKEYYEDVRKHKAYLAVEGNKAGSRPKELFADVVEEVEERFIKERSSLRDAIRKLDFHVAESTTVEDLTAAVAKEEPELAEVQESHRKLVLEEIQGRNKEKAAHEAKKVKEARDSLASLMRHSRDITEKSSFEDAQDALARKPEFKAVSEEVAKEVLSEVQAALAAKAEARKSRHSHDDESRDKHKKRHKKDHKEDRKEHKSKRRHDDESEGEEKRSKRHRKDKDRRGSDSPDSPRDKGDKRRDEDGEL